MFPSRSISRRRTAFLDRVNGRHRVLLDRNKPRNRPGRHILGCKNVESYEDKNSDFCSPAFGTEIRSRVCSDGIRESDPGMLCGF